MFKAFLFLQVAYVFLNNLFFQQHSDDDFDHEDEGQNNIAKVSWLAVCKIH